jgi:WS/DGAT/MGAT family acyltransferase
MIPLSNLDAVFLHLDSKNSPMHIGSLTVYDQSTAPGGVVRYKDILSFYSQRLGRAKCYRRRLIKVPFNLGNPYWLEDPNFDIEFHVRHIGLPHPGDWRQLCILAARLFSRPLDLSRPLWEVYVIEGLDNIEGLPKGCFALLHKVHHCAIDGVSGAEIIAATHDLSSEFGLNEIRDSWEPEQVPSDFSMYVRGLIQTAQMPVRYGRYIKKYSKRWIDAVKWFRSGARHLANAPMTRFNNASSPHRVFEGIDFSVADLKAIKNAIGGSTLNDVIIAICGGGMHHYLKAKHELPGQSLLAMMPKSIRSDDQQREEGNQISIMRVAIGSHIADPLERLHFVRTTTKDAKELLSILGDDIVANTLALLLPPVSRMTGSAMTATRIAQTLRLFNTVVTNVPGPDFPMYFMGCKMLSLYGMGPPSGGLGLFQVVFSYNGKISIGAVSCRDMMPDPTFYRQCLQQAYDELRKATVGAADAAA